MEVVADNRVSDIAIKCSAQSSKTQTFLNLACWCVSEDPGPAMWVMAAKDEAETFVRDRAAPTFKNCRLVEGAKIRESKTRIHLQHHAVLLRRRRLALETPIQADSLALSRRSSQLPDRRARHRFQTDACFLELPPPHHLHPRPRKRCRGPRLQSRRPASLPFRVPRLLAVAAAQIRATQVE